MGSKGSATTTSTSAPPQAVQDMYKYLTEQGKTLQQQPYQQYTGQLVPDINATQQAGVNQSQQYSQAAQPYLQQAGQMTQQASMGYNPENYAQGVAGYMSPYMQQAMGATAAQLQNVNQQQQQQLLGNTIQQGAFGGDRGKIAQAALMNQQNLALGQTLSGMANQGYQNAAQNYIQGLNSQGQLGAQYGNIGNLAQTAGMTGAQQLTTAGAVPYAVQQAQDAANYQQFAQGQAYPWQTLGSLANIASGLGAGQGGTSSTTSPGPNSMNAVLGLGTSLLTMSDERSKDNMEPIGKTFDGQNIYKFNYKGDPKTNIGLMAQEVEKRNPSAVHKTEGGLRMVDYDAATQGAADRGHFAGGGSSMGGLVPESMERHPYAYGGIGQSQRQFGETPYADDPLAEEMAALAKITLGSYIPHSNIQGGGGIGLPHAQPYQEPAFDTSGIAGFGKALYGKYGPASIADRGVQVGDVSNLYSSPIGPMPEYAKGGLVARSHHANGDTPPQENEVPADQGFLGNLGSSISKGLSSLPSTSDQPGLIGNLFNKGQPLSDDARQAIMAAGFGIMASPSPFVAQAIGQGGLTGMNTYAKQKQINYETQKALADQALEGRRIDVSQELAGIQGKTLGLKTFEDLKQMYRVEPDPDISHADPVTGAAPLKVYGINGQEIPLSVYMSDLATIAKATGMPIQTLIHEHISQPTPAPRAFGGRTAHAIGGPAYSDNNDLSGKLDSASGSNDQFSTDNMIQSALKSAKITPSQGETPSVQVAQAAPIKATDAVPDSAGEELDPSLKQILDYQKQAKDIERFLAANPNFSNEQKTILNSKANDLRTKALELSGREFSTDTNVKYRLQYGANQKPNEPPAPLTSESPRGQIDPDTGIVKTVPVDIGYPETKGYPTSKLPKNAVKVGDDPLYSKAVEQSVPFESNFLDQSQNTQEAITNLAKFASAAKVIETSALKSDKTRIAAVLQSLGFDKAATAVNGAANIGEAQVLAKSALDSAVSKVTSSFSKPTQSEFHLLESKASPNLDLQPDANFSLSSTQLGAALWQDALRRDWLNAKSQGAQNFLAYQGLWKKQNNREMFEDSAQRLLGNYAGQELPSVDKLVSGGLYVVPPVKKGENLTGLKSYLYNNGFTTGDVVTLPRVNHYKGSDGKMHVDFDEPYKVPDNQIYQKILSQPGFGFGE